MMTLLTRSLLPVLTGLLLMGSAPERGAAAVVLQLPGDRQILESAERALEDGQFDVARERVEAWWANGEAGRDRLSLQQALWLRARLTVDAEAAELLYRRIVVEFPGGAWSDQALLRLASGAQARDELGPAQRYLQILVRDYPSSPFRVEARAELARLDAELARSEATPARPAGSAAGAASGATAARPTPGATPPGSPPSSSPPPAAPEAGSARDLDGSFTLQFGAFGEPPGAHALAAELRVAGLDARVVQVEGSALYRVRVEAFTSREAAEARALALRERGFEVIVSPDRDRERPVR
jgi:cell division septation protein DedD